jgi:hypothetical protein
MSENFVYQYLRYFNKLLICRKILRHWDSGFTSHPMEAVPTFIALKNPLPRPGLNALPLGPVTSTLTTTSPKRPSHTRILK